MNVQEYLSRINFTKPVHMDVETLRGLQLAHMLTVPFENLDISLGRKMQLSEQALWDKIVVHKRGGFCYELNGLFAWLLKDIGFEVTYLNARDYHPESDTFGIDFDHLVLMVRIPNESTRWLVDVGYGDNFTMPMNLDDRKEQIEGLRGYWIEPLKGGYQLWRRNHDETRQRQYYFDLTAHIFPSEYEATCLYHQTSPESFFTQHRIVSRLTHSGHISLDNDRLIITKNGGQEEKTIRENKRQQLLKEYFDVVSE
jgi:N-hydroxyarylamine O-acetyltransferase